jgi:hypothetical protein
MLQVCEASGDVLGQLQTLQQMLELTCASTGDDEHTDKQQEMVAKMAELKKELASEFGKE